MEEEYIDVQESQKNYERTLARFKKDPRISDQNRALVLKFIRDAAVGKTILGKSKKRIGPSRLRSYINHLRHLIYHVEKDVDKLTQGDMEDFIEAMQQNLIRCRDGKQRAFSAAYKVDIKISIRRFYTWLLGDNRRTPEIVEWFDMSFDEKETTALTPAEVQRLIDHCLRIKHKAFIQTLFDGGPRIGELLNVRLRHVRLYQVGHAQEQRQFFLIRLPFSKTLTRTVALPLRESTKWLRMWLEQHPARPTILPDGTLHAENTDALLFPMRVERVRTILRSIGRQALRKRVYPHLLRHSSVTYWANYLTFAQLCKKYGWTMISRMPRKYIDRSGIDEIRFAAEFTEAKQQSDGKLHEFGQPTDEHLKGSPLFSE